ncbi:hypothetical protein [Psychrilyobacter atlanticus]|uniref:hypothetical protein n=1 Tax=Psychrilyobacter atlanticus TaxID=271091 RepID=UPI00048DDF9B|nr:hypothetical protein [Psychrilyobacter atlanticus]
MIVRKLKDTEAEQVKDLFLYYIDQVKDLEIISLSKFREISNNGLVYLMHSITEHQSPSYNDTLKIDDIN